MNLDLAAAVAAVRSVVGGPCMLHKPPLTAEDADAVRDVVAAGDMVRADIVREFERVVAETTERKHCVATTTGTTALTAALLTPERGGAVCVVPILTYVATPAAVEAAGLVPVIWGAPGWGRGELAVVVDLFGLPATLPPGPGPVVVDACESLGTVVDGVPCAGRGVAAALSFNANKIVTCGQGGALVTDDDRIAEAARTFINQGRRGGPAWSPDAWVADRVGTNGRMSPLSAALGLSQLRRLPALLVHHRLVYERYCEALADTDGLAIQHAPGGVAWNHWVGVAKVEDAADREPLLRALNEIGIEARPCFPPLHRAGVWATGGTAAEDYADRTAAEDYADRTLLLPSGDLPGVRP